MNTRPLSPRSLSDDRTTCIRPVAERGEPRRLRNDELIGLTRTPWPLDTGTAPLVVRPSSIRDFGAVAQLHRRCSARSLLDRYRRGGRPPAPAVLDAELRNPLAVVALVPDNRIVATGSIRRDPHHNPLCAQVSLLVDDAWHGHGIGSGLLSHLAGVAQVVGFRELIAYPATALAPVQHMMIDVGRTRMVPDLDAHLHTYLPEAATLGLGSVRRRLAG